MEYKFKKKEDWHIVEIADVKYKILNRFTYYGWNIKKVQEIIDGIEISQESPKGEEYVWANEDLTLYSNKNGILLEDMIAQRFGENRVELLTLRLEHEVFLVFMEDFKKFVKENS